MTFLLSGALLLVLTIQQTPEAQSPQATFRSAVDRVAVDVTVVDRQGRPVADLAPAEFTLEVDGKRRAIASAEFISLRRLADPGPPPAHYATNTIGRAGRLIVLVVDQNNISVGAGRLVFEAASEFIATLNPNDRVALHLIPGTGPVVDFTANHALVAQHLKAAVGRARSTTTLNTRVGISEARAIGRNDQQTLNEVLERECAGNLDVAERAHCQRMIVNDARMVSGEGRARMAESLVSLRGLMQRLRPGNGRKTVVLLSEGLVLDQGIQDIGWVAPLAAEAQIVLFVLQIESSAFGAGAARVSPSLSQDRALGQEGLSLLAGFAGGGVVPLSPSNPGLGFARVGTELSGYYLISFEPEPAERDGRMHDISIGTSRDGLTVRARRKFAMDVIPDAASLGTRVSAALASPLDLSELPLKAAPYVLGETGGQLKVIIAANVDRTAQPSTEAALGYALMDAQGRLAGSHLEPSLGPSGEAVDHVTSALSVPPGIYSLRVAVVDAGGREGAVGHTFDARLHAAGQVHWSDLVLSERRASTGQLSLIVDGPTGSTLQAYMELYSDVPSMLDRASVVIEVSRRDDGLPLVSAPLVFSAVQEPGRRAGETSFDVGLLGDGGFIVRAIVRIGGAEAGRALRAFVIAKRP